MSMFNPPHPGLVLREYLGKSAVSTAAEHLGVSRVTLSRVLNGRAGVSADLALRLADAFGTSPELWAGMQSQYDLSVASRRRRKKVAHLHRVPKLARSVCRSAVRVRAGHRAGSPRPAADPHQELLRLLDPVWRSAEHQCLPGVSRFARSVTGVESAGG